MKKLSFIVFLFAGYLSAQVQLTKGVQVGGTSTSGGLNQLTGDVIAGPGTGSQVATVKGLSTIPFCTGFTPTNGQVVTLTTASSPNPCWTAATPSSGTGTVTHTGALTLHYCVLGNASADIAIDPNCYSDGASNYTMKSLTVTG